MRVQLVVRVEYLVADQAPVRWLFYYVRYVIYVRFIVLLQWLIWIVIVIIP
jgi:hypothetical protein